MDNRPVHPFISMMFARKPPFHELFTSFSHSNGGFPHGHDTGHSGAWFSGFSVAKCPNATAAWTRSSMVAASLPDGILKGGAGMPGNPIPASIVWRYTISG
jgi:hypothetical protein